MSQTELLRASILHTPRNSFTSADALEHFADGALVLTDGRIAATGDYSSLRRRYADASTRDLRGGFLLPGFVDTHIHFPQVRVLGGLGYSLLDWLTGFALPEEAKMAEPEYAAAVAAEFLRGLASHGTTTALVFGAHFADATAILLDAAANSGLRVCTGLVMADRMLTPELHQTPDVAYRASKDLIRRYHSSGSPCGRGSGRLSYAITPRFALSSSEGMLEACQALKSEEPSVLFQTHINENAEEICEVRRLFPWAQDYLSVYERFGLISARSVLAHNLHASDSELSRLAAAGSAIAHCPCSNAALGSGFFPMRRHLTAGVRFALGTDVGAGTGFGMFKEGLQAYLLQRLCPDGYPLTGAHLLYLATLAGADALGMGAETGDLSPGKSADFVYVRPPDGSPLKSVLAVSADPLRILGALFTLGGSESIREVRVGGDVVYSG